MQRIVEISDLPAKRHLFIFGAARGGEFLLAALTQRNIQVAGFIDDMASCAPQCLPLLRTAEFLAAPPQDAAVLIASQHWGKIAGLFAGSHIPLFNAMPLIDRQDINQSVAIDQGSFYSAIMWRMAQRLSFLHHSDFPEVYAFGAVSPDEAKSRLRAAAVNALAAYRDAVRFGPKSTELMTRIADCLECLEQQDELVQYVDGVLAEQPANVAASHEHQRFIADMRRRRLSSLLALDGRERLAQLLAADAQPAGEWAISRERTMPDWVAAWGRAPTTHVEARSRPAPIRVRDGGLWHDLAATFNEPELASVHLRDVVILDGLLPLTSQGDHLVDRDEWQARVRSMPSVLAEQPDRILHEVPKALDMAEEPCLFLGGLFGYRDNYAHFVVQQVARIACLADCAHMAGRKLAFAGELTRTQDEVLTAMGFGQERRVILSGTRSSVLRDAVIVSPPTRDRFPSGAELQVMRRRVLAHYGLPEETQGTRNIYLSRRAQYRNPANWLALEQHAERLGFEVIDLGFPPFSEQVRMFSQAKVICGPMGAAFTNMLFAPPGTVVALLQPRENLTALFSAMIASLGHRALMCLGDLRFDTVGGHWNALGYDIDEDDAVETMRAALAAAETG